LEVFRKPVVHVKQVQELTKSSFKAANSLVDDFVKAGIVEEKTGQTRNRVFNFTEYLNLF
jgi:hypothetical protein